MSVPRRQWWRATLRDPVGTLVAPAPAQRLDTVRMLTVGYCVVWVVARFGYWRDSARIAAWRWKPVGVVGWLGLRPSATVVTVLAAATFVVGLVALTGRAWALTGALTALGFLYLTTFGVSWGQILHTENLPALHLLVLAAAPVGRGRSRNTGWPLRVMSLVTVATYVVAGVAKLRLGGGTDWLTGDRLLRLVAHDNVRKRLLADVYSPLAGPLVGHPLLFRIGAAVALVVELGAPLALLGGRVRYVWIASAWMFHVVVLAVMAVLFPYPLCGIAYASMLPVERLRAGGNARHSARSSSRRVRGRRDRAGAHRRLDRDDLGPHRRVAAEAGEQPVVDRRPHPLDVLALPAGVEAATVEVTPVRLDRSHTASRPVPVRPLHVSTGTDHPSGRPGDEVQGGGQLGGRAGGLGGAVAVGLVHRDHVGQLEHALLDPLQARRRRAPASAAGTCRPCPRRPSPTARRRPSRRAPRRSRPPPARRWSRAWRRVTPPRRPPLGDGRMNACSDRRPAAPSGSCRRGCCRRCGSTSGRRRAPRPGGPAPASRMPTASMNVDLPAPGTPVMPMRWAPPASGRSRPSSSCGELAGGRRGVDSTSVIARPSATRSPARTPST